MEYKALFPYIIYLCFPKYLQAKKAEFDTYIFCKIN